MLIYHEGLPGSGKSLAAMKDHVIPALKKGRQVWGYVEGWDDPVARIKIAMLAEKTGEEIDQLLHFLNRDQITDWHKLCPHDCLIVIDELQNFYPTGRTKLDPATTQGVAEHRHKGQDMLLMGQDLRDCHALFRRRVDQKVYFRNLDVVGAKNSYLWEVQKTTSPDKWETIQRGKATYDPEYFGTYKSHEDATGNTERFTDDRANVFKSKTFRFLLPLAGIMTLLGIAYLVSFFRAETFVKEEPPKQTQSAPATVLPVASPTPQPLAKPLALPSPVEPVQKVGERLMSENDFSATSPQDRVQTLSGKYRLRVGGFWEGRGKRNGFIEWRDDSNTIKARYSFDELQGMGYTVMSNQFGTVVTLVNGPAHYLATMWPIDSSFAQPNQEQVRAMDGRQPGWSPPSSEPIKPPVPDVEPQEEAPPEAPARPRAVKPPSRLPVG